MGSPGPMIAVGSLKKTTGRGGEFHARFPGVVAVVEADGEDARRVGEGRVQTGIFEADLGSCESADGTAGDDVERVLEAAGAEVEDGLRVVKENAGANGVVRS